MFFIYYLLDFINYWGFIFRVLDNNTVAGLMVVIMGGIVAGFVYRKEKNIDRRYKAVEVIGESLISLEDHCKSILFIMDRLINTNNRILAAQQANPSPKTQTMSSETVNAELTPLVEKLMNSIPDTVNKFETRLSLYFDDNEAIAKQGQAIFDELKKWHDFVQKYIINESEVPFDITKRSSQIPQLSIAALHEAIRKLIRLSV